MGWGESPDNENKIWWVWLIGGFLFLAIIAWIRDCNTYEKEMVEYEAWEKATQYENQLMPFKKKLVCIRGHKFNKKTSYIRLDGTGKDCKVCRAIRQIAYMDRIGKRKFMCFTCESETVFRGSVCTVCGWPKG